MLIEPASASELANIAQEVGELVIDGVLRYPSETGSWQLGGVDLGEVLAQYRDQQVVLIIAPVGAAAPDVILCGVCGFPVNETGRCPRCALLTQDEAAAIRCAVDEERLLDEIEEHLAGLDGDGQ
jgi:hypothetical protein